MSNLILSLHTDQPANPEQIGQKAASLQHLARAGFPVPPGMVITTAVFQTALAPFASQIQALRHSGDLRNPTVAHGIAQAIVSLLADLQLPSGLLPDLVRALAALGPGPWVVRSSATVEDLPNASFAGYYQTVLGVSDETALAAAILTCWRSYFTAHALTAQATYTTDKAGMAVLIQPLLHADCAGVCFTVDPVRQQADRLLITSAWGLGVGVVAGSAPADTFRLRRSDLGQEESVIADKHTAIRPDPAGGVQAVAVAADQRQIACLPPEWLRRLGQFGLAVEQHLGQPQDIEWAIADQRVWLLQSRPITTLPADVRQATHFPIDWANEAERTRLWWLDHQTSRASATLLPAELAFVMTSSQGGQAAVEFSGAAKTRWRKYVNGRVYMAVADSPVSPGDQRIRQAAWRDLCDRLHGQGLSLWDYWGPEVIRATQRLSAFDPKSANGKALADFLEDTLAASQRHWQIHTMLPRRGPFEQLLATYAQLTGKAPEVAEAELPLLLQRAETVQTRLIEALYDLAALALEKGPIASLLEEKMVARWTRLTEMPEAAAFVAQVEQLLASYGGRVVMTTVGDEGGSAVELALPWREVPEHLLEMISHYLPLAQTARSPRTAREQAWAEFQTWITAICQTATDATLVATFRQHLQAARHQAAFLDDHNHYIDQLSQGQYHQALVNAGRWLAARGDLPQPYATFWLQPAEILAALRAPAKQEFGSLLAQRQVQFAGWSARQPPAFIGLPDPQLPARPPLPDLLAGQETIAPILAANTLRGQVASAGQGTGRARILAQSAHLPDLAPGDVLIARNADPQWTPLFPLLAGIVLEGGGAGDHAAITAREFGIPAVFGVAHATLSIPSAAWVTVDGETGRVTWE